MNKTSERFYVSKGQGGSNGGHSGKGLFLSGFFFPSGRPSRPESTSSSTDSNIKYGFLLIVKAIIYVRIVLMSFGKFAFTTY